MAMIKSADQIRATLNERGPGRPPENKKCTLPYCDDKHHGRGYCLRHWSTWRRWGDPNHIFIRGKWGKCRCPSHAPQGR